MSIESSEPMGRSCSERWNSACMENWNWEIDSPKRLPRNWRIEKKLLWRNRPNETSKKWWIAHASREESDDCESIVDSNSGLRMSDAREFYDPGTANSSGATHVLDQTSTILSSRTLPRCDSGWPELYGYYGKLVWTTTVSRRTIHCNLQQFKEFGIFISRCETWCFRDSKERHEKGIMNTPIQPSHFQSRSGILDRTSGTYSHVGMMD